MQLPLFIRKHSRNNVPVTHYNSLFQLRKSNQLIWQLTFFFFFSQHLYFSCSFLFSVFNIQKNEQDTSQITSSTSDIQQCCSSLSTLFFSETFHHLCHIPANAFGLNSQVLYDEKTYFTKKRFPGSSCKDHKHNCNEQLLCKEKN